MVLVRRRYYFWLARAYIKRWKKTILLSLVIGVAVFFTAIFSFNYYLIPKLDKSTQKIGYTGIFQTIPEDILYEVSYGLTTRNVDGTIKSGAAERWEVKEDGRTFVFYLKKGSILHNGEEFTTQKLDYNFKDVKKEIIDDYTVSYTVNDPYSPFLTTVTKPILIKNTYGLGAYKLVKADVNSGFLKSVTLESVKDSKNKKIFYFYPSQDSVKQAYVLGEIDSIYNVGDPKIENSDLSKWKKVKVKKNVDYQKLVTLFYNNEDQNLSNKKLRQALDYAIPAEFTEGERAYSPIPPTSIFFSQTPNYGISDPEISKTILGSIELDKNIVFELTTTEEYADIARRIIVEWEKIGIHTKLKITNKIPTTFQMLLHPVMVPKDPDQYTLWHSQQINNIAHYKNLRIDKLLEDGRSIVDEEKRKTIYADFQKYLIDDVPASFILFPYEYTIERR